MPTKPHFFFRLRDVTVPNRYVTCISLTVICGSTYNVGRIDWGRSLSAINFPAHPGEIREATKIEIRSNRLLVYGRSTLAGKIEIWRLLDFLQKNSEDFAPKIRIHQPRNAGRERERQTGDKRSNHAPPRRMGMQNQITGFSRTIRTKVGGKQMIKLKILPWLAAFGMLFCLQGIGFAQAIKQRRDSFTARFWIQSRAKRRGSRGQGQQTWGQDPARDDRFGS